MQKEIEVLKTIFYDYNIDSIKSSLVKKYSPSNILNNKIKKNHSKELIYILQNRMMNCSQDEITNIVKAELEDNSSNIDKSLWPYNLLRDISREFLENETNKIHVKYEKLLLWRNAVRYLDQDLFICAFLADQDIHTRISRKDFNWDIVLKTDNDRLHNMLQKGMAENHFHLNGSSPYFQLSWISLMNKIVNREKEFKAAYMDEMNLEKNNENKPIEILVYQAAIIRMYLFRWLNNENNKENNELENLLIEIKNVNNKLQNFFIDFKDDKSESYIIGLKDKNNKIKNFLKSFKDENNEFKNLLICLNEEKDELENFLIHLEDENSKEKSVFESLVMYFNEEKSKFENFLTALKKFEKRFKLCLGINPEGEELYYNNYSKSINEDTIMFIDIYKNYFQEKINNLRFSLRKNSRDNEHIVDYALEKKLFTNNSLTEYLVGERYFVYSCLHKFYSSPEKYSKYKALFHCYIIMKTRFRNEMVQANKNVGFKNFANYQDRKECFVEGDPVFKDAIKSLAVLSSIKNQNLKSLELRITPAKTSLDIKKKVNHIDKVITDKVIEDNSNLWLNNDLLEKEISKKTYYNMLHENNKIYVNHCNNINKIKEKYFFVFHYPKVIDNTKFNDYTKICGELFYCRHKKLRDKMKKNAMAFVKFRESFSSENNRVYGIDACAAEIGCRPEVFAHSFRYMRTYIVDNQKNLVSYFNKQTLPKISITYHVGEDFLDIADGLRAIDEAMLFLGMKHGDRLGHAIALGIDVKDWYKRKENEVVLPVIDILDNIAWLIMKLKEEAIEESYKYINYLEPLFWKYYYHVYDSCISEISIQAYNDAWKLRGDEPDNYRFISKDSLRNKNMKVKSNKITYWDRCSYNPLVSSVIRENGPAAEIYRSYHFNKDIRLRGSKIEIFKVEALYIEAVKKVQKSMQKKAVDKGISVETNPSSNYLISTFRRYDKHPIINWYNRFLTQDPDKLRECTQIPVCINTDDQGVFDTSLENEYALVALALQKAKDEKGEPLYSPTMIYEWLDKVRDMGIQLSFINNNPERRSY